MRERVRGSGVGQVVRGNVNGLERRDGAFFRRRDALLQVAHFRRKRRLIADRGGRAAEQRGNFRSRLREAEDIVDEEEHVLPFFVAEIFRHGKRGQRDAHTRSRRFVHLPVNERDLGFGNILRVNNAGFAHFAVEVVAFAGTLADAREHGVAAVRLRDVVDELHDEHRLADARAAEGADFSALDEGANQVDDLDARFEQFRARALFDERRRVAVNRVFFRETDFALAVHGIARDVEDAAEHAFADGRLNRRSRVRHRHAAHETVRRAHRDGADDAGAEVLLHFEHEPRRRAVERVVHLQRVVDRGNRLFVELRVHDRADNLGNCSCRIHKLFTFF